MFHKLLAAVAVRLTEAEKQSLHCVAVYGGFADVEDHDFSVT